MYTLRPEASVAIVLDNVLYNVDAFNPVASRLDENLTRREMLYLVGTHPVLGTLPIRSQSQEQYKLLTPREAGAWINNGSALQVHNERLLQSVFNIRIASTIEPDAPPTTPPDGQPVQTYIRTNTAANARRGRVMQA